ncbi:Serine/arginine-rich splicing factor 7 [Nymphon striatum]|nr:Serine/arginine-rich splicing factor 7 [Nymphon striatum]
MKLPFDKGMFSASLVLTLVKSVSIRNMSRFVDRNRPNDCKVYVGDLGNGASKQDLEEAFSYYGHLRNVWVARNPPGFAFVEFEDPRDAEDSCRGLDGKSINGQRIRVELSSNRPKRNGRPPPPRRGRPFHPDDRCHECGDKGHYARDCSKQGSGSGSKGGSNSNRRGGSRFHHKEESNVILMFDRSRSRSPAARNYRSRSRSHSRSPPKKNSRSHSSVMAEPRCSCAVACMLHDAVVAVFFCDGQESAKAVDSSEI